MLKRIAANRLVSLIFTFALMFSVMGPMAQHAAAGQVLVGPTENGGSTDSGLRAYYCNFGNPEKYGAVWEWWDGDLALEKMPAGYVNCWDLIIDTSVCGQVSATMYSWINRYDDFSKRDQLRYNEKQDVLGTITTHSPSENYQGSPVHYFREYTEDYNGGFVEVRFGIRVSEYDTVRGMSTYIFNHSSQGSYGPYYLVNTDCEQSTQFLGCSQGYFKNNGIGGDMTLASVGLVTAYDGNTTLLQVLSNPGNGKLNKGVQTYDGFTRQQVTAYFNMLWFGSDYPFTLEQIQNGDVSMADLEYYNHGGDDVICP